LLTPHVAAAAAGLLQGVSGQLTGHFGRLFIAGWSRKDHIVVAAVGVEVDGSGGELSDVSDGGVDAVDGEDGWSGDSEADESEADESEEDGGVRRPRRNGVFRAFPFSMEAPGSVRSVRREALGFGVENLCSEGAWLRIWWMVSGERKSEVTRSDLERGMGVSSGIPEGSSRFRLGALLCGEECRVDKWSSIQRTTEVRPRRYLDNSGKWRDSRSRSILLDAG
jgi:hypothetical protein